MNTRLKVDKYTAGGKIRLGIYRGKRSYSAYLTEIEARQLHAALEYAWRTSGPATGWTLEAQDDISNMNHKESFGLCVDCGKEITDTPEHEDYCNKCFAKET